MTALPQFILVLTFVVLAGASTRPVLAQTAEDDDDHHDHANHVAVFVGATTPTKKKSETSFTLGADYERRFSDLFGVLGIADLAFGSHKRTGLFAVNLAIHPASGWRLAIGPGFELVDKDDPTPSDPMRTTLSSFFILRGSVLYEFHAGDWAVGPMLSVDAIGETKTNIVYGLSIGRGF